MHWLSQFFSSRTKLQKVVEEKLKRLVKRLQEPQEPHQPQEVQQEIQTTTQAIQEIKRVQEIQDYKMKKVQETKETKEKNIKRELESEDFEIPMTRGMHGWAENYPPMLVRQNAFHYSTYSAYSDTHHPNAFSVS